MLLRLTVFAAFLACASLSGQEKSAEPNATFQVEFRINDSADTSGKSTRRYTFLLDSSGRGNFRIGQRVPFVTSTLQQNQNVSTQYQYVDIGVNIDCRAKMSGQKVALRAEIDITSLLPSDKGQPATAPLTASARVNVDSLLVPGKPASIATVDDPVTQRRMDITAVVNPIP
jgi:hypothetical protein